jgi:hypothetical protein
VPTSARHHATAPLTPAPQVVPYTQGLSRSRPFYSIDVSAQPRRGCRAHAALPQREATLRDAIAEFKRLLDQGWEQQRRRNRRLAHRASARSHNVHRLVITADGNPAGILSQSDIVRYISQARACCGSALDRLTRRRPAQQAEKHKGYLSRSLAQVPPLCLRRHCVTMCASRCAQVGLVSPEKAAQLVKVHAASQLRAALTPLRRSARRTRSTARFKS